VDGKPIHARTAGHRRRMTQVAPEKSPLLYDYGKPPAGRTIEKAGMTGRAP
jgi:hypothetical protein